MYFHKKHYRPIYVVRSADQELAQRAKAEGIAKTMLINRYVREGLERPSPGRAPVPEPQGAFLISEGFYLDGMLIEPLEDRAVDVGLTTAELIRRFIAEGLALAPKQESHTRRQELSTLKTNLEFYQRRAIEAARPFIETAAKIREQIAAELKALRACCRHENIIELKGAVAVYACACGDVDRHSTRVGLCVACGTFEGTCSLRSFTYGRFPNAQAKDVGYDEFAQLRKEFLEFIDDR